MSVVPAEIPIFSRESIEAMSPIGKGIAAMLQEVGYIKITDRQTDPSKVAQK